MKGKLGVLILVAVLFLGSTNNVWATVGPVHVELNTYWWADSNHSRSRANSITSFRIFMRYNISVKIHDEIKVWFPAYEAFKSDNPEDIIKNFCDGRQKIDEKITDPRFVPNEEYFKKFNNHELRKVKQLYEYTGRSKDITQYDCPDLSGKPNWSDVCEPKGNYPSLIKDPSGLGCWLLGTVMPSMPVDEKERWEKVHTIAGSIAVGYNPCDCQPFAMTSTCHERLLKFISPPEIEAWRKGYNSIDLNTSAWTGIISPATPGRYYVKVATTPEPEPVESEAFVLPCSDITDVKYEQYPVRKNPTLMSVSFKTGEGGALDNYYSHIFVRLPKQFKVTEMPEKAIVVNGEPVKEKVKPVKDGDYSVLDIKCPANADNFGQVTVDFLSKSAISLDYSKGLEGVSVSTSSEPNYIKSPDITIPDKPETTFGKPEELVNSSILIRTPLKKQYPAKTKMTLTFPKDFMLPNHRQIIGVHVNGRSVSATGDDKQKTLTLVYDQPLSTFVSIFIPAESGIINPPKGNYSLSFNIGDEIFDCGSFEIGESKIYIGDLTFSVDQAALHTRLSFSFKPSSGKPLKPGDWIAVTFPEETKLPDEIFLDQIKIGGYTPTSIEKINLTLKIILSTNINVNVKSLVDFNFEFVNPRHNQNFFLKVETSLGDVGQSEPVDLLPAPLQSSIYFKDPDKPNCGEWFNKPPILGFECLNPEAKITFWFNGWTDRVIHYVDELRMAQGTEKATISWRAEYDGHFEETHTIDFKLDSVSPKLTVSNPESVTKVTNKSVFKLMGSRGFTEMRTNGNNTSYQVTDSVSYKIKGIETTLMEGEIYETSKRKFVQFDFFKDITLEEGINVIEIIARDQACNETIITKKIILDTTPPKMELVSPLTTDKVISGKPVLLKIKAEADATVFIDKVLANIESVDGDRAVFAKWITPKTGRNVYYVEVNDAHGNSSIASFFVVAKPEKTTIVMTLGKTSWTVDDVAQPPLKAAPTNKFTEPNLKALNGTTYMPISQIAPVLGCVYDWYATEKKITLKQALDPDHDKVLQLWINKTTAIIDGIETKFDPKGILFPAIINSYTCLPFRWFGENLGASVSYDVKTKQITLVYPKQ